MKYFRYFFNAIWAIPAVLVIRAIKPWWHVRMGTITSHRIGHFVLDASLYLAHNALDSRKGRIIDLFWLPGPTCNEQWARMVRRQLIARGWVRYLIFYSNRIPGTPAHQLPPLHNSRDIHGILQKSPTQFEFTPEEDHAAKTWLRHHGWQEGEPFVCLLVRDSAYLSSHSAFGEDDWSYHDYRDSEIETYVDAVQALIDKGYWVIRMGKVMHERLPVHHSRVIDYPFVEDQDDLLDIWLSSHCTFFISTGSGIDTVPLAYKVPIVFVNCMPFIFFSYAATVCIPKHLRWANSRGPLTLREHLHHTYFSTEDYAKAGLVIEDNSPSEIVDVVMEMAARVTGSWQNGTEDLVRQRRFWDAYRAWPDFYKYNGYIHPEARVGSAWLKSMGEPFFE